MTTPSTTERIVYLSGRYLPLSQAAVPVMDRGFLLGDAVYEVIPVFGGQPFRFAQHIERLNRSLLAIRISNPLELNRWQEIATKLIEQFPGQDQSLYIQVTRGVAPTRDHTFPAGLKPTVLFMSSPLDKSKLPDPHKGIAVVTVEDLRWKLCRIKATTLLANVLARQQASDEGALEAIMLRDGYALEGAASNLFIVVRDQLITPPTGDEILTGITRDLVLELATNAKIPWRERAIPTSELYEAQEIWLTSSIREVIPVVTLNHKPVADGRPGAMWKKMYDLYENYKQSLRSGV